jgi:D-3-phosphoglycerate dehydrogenase
MTSILLLEDIHDTAAAHLFAANLSLEQYEGALAGAALIAALRQHEMIGIRSGTHLDRDVILRAGHLIAIGCFCIGTSQVDLVAAAEVGIPVFNAPFSNTRSVAELVIAEAILLLRRIPEKNALAHAGTWAKGTAGSVEARGKTIAIVGYGNIGSQVGLLAEAIGMRVLYYDIKSKLSLGLARSTQSLADAVQHADVVTLHVPATAQTKLVIDASILAHFKRNAVLINASRGTVVDIDALAHALETKMLAGAAIDVFPFEPKTPSDNFDSVLRNLPNVILTPHIGGSTEEAQENIGMEVATKLISFVTSGDTEGAVNFPQINPGPLQSPARLLNVHSNVPGALAVLNTRIAEEGINIVAQHLLTLGDTGYALTDMDRPVSARFIGSLIKEPGFVRTRLLIRETDTHVTH